MTSTSALPENATKETALSESETKVLASAHNAMVLAKAAAYDAMKAAEEAEKRIALADAARDAALAAIAQAHGYTGEVRVVGNKLIGG